MYIDANPAEGWVLRVNITMTGLESSTKDGQAPAAANAGAAGSVPLPSVWDNQRLLIPPRATGRRSARIEDL